VRGEEEEGQRMRAESIIRCGLVPAITFFVSNLFYCWCCRTRRSRQRL
jgi:hypothetical protein